MAVLLRDLVAAGATVATAESLTGGLVCAALTDVPGSSAAVRGGVVAYATDAKAAVLGGDAEVLRQHGAVSEAVAAAMATAARERFGATFGVATTGVAGPDAQDGHPVGEVYVAVASGAADVVVRRCMLAGDRAAIRQATVEAALELLATRLHALAAAEPSAATGEHPS